MSAPRASKAGTPALAIILLGAFAMLLTAGCGDGSGEPSAHPSPAAEGSSFDAPSASKAVQPKEEAVAPPAAKREENVIPAVVEIPAEAKAPPLVEAPATPPALPEAPAKEIPTPVPAVPVPTVAEPEAKKEAAKNAANEPPMAITFAKLASYRYYPPASRAKPGEKPAAKSPIPESVRALDGKKVTIDGYMIPIDFQKGKIMSFILSRAMFGCCYGDAPQITEVIKVVSADGKPMSFQPTSRVTGILEVGEEYDSEGYIDSIYRIKADVVVPGKER